MDVPITKLRCDETIVNRESPAYVQLVKSMEKDGFIGAIVVDSDYNIVDGIHRYAAAKDAGIATITCKSMTGNPLLYSVKV